LLQIEPLEAWVIAQAIRSIAEERSWGFPDLETQDRPADPKRSNAPLRDLVCFWRFAHAITGTPTI
jgi:hypothetical protein